ncbi:DUF55-domain-containing protein, partial [Corynespora cassiicola Philippines]
MAGTRRSTRQTTSTALRYAESSSGDEKLKRNGKKATRQKRARIDDPDDVDAPSPPPPKKAARASSKSKSKSKPKASPAPELAADSESPKLAKRTAVPPPVPSSDSNRDADGHQEVFWLLKAEPLPRYENGVNVAFSIDDLRKCTEPEPWSGVRNPQARNNMQAMRKGDLGFFYHSNAKPSGVVGILRVVEEAKVDESAFDPKDPYHDPKSDREKPKWFCVGVEFVEKFGEVVDLATIKGYAGKGGPLENMQLVTLSRLSVCRVRKEEWEFVLGLAKREGGKHEKEEVTKDERDVKAKEEKTREHEK